MAPEEARRGGPESGKGDFHGRDLLVGRPEGAQSRSTTGANETIPATTSPRPGAHDDAIREILEMVRATAVRSRLCIMLGSPVPRSHRKQ